MYFGIGYHTFTRPSLPYLPPDIYTVQLITSVYFRHLPRGDAVRVDCSYVVAKHCSWRSSLATDRRSRPVGRPPTRRQGWPRGKNGTPFYGVPFFHGEDARPRVGRMPHSRSSILVGTRAADHLHVGSSRETFADIIGKKAKSLPLKLHILSLANCVAS